MAFDQARFDSLLAQAAQYQDAKNAAAAAAGVSRSDPTAFMNAGNQLANAVNAFQAGNIADVNKALTQSGLQGSQVMTGLNLGAADMLNLEQQGVKFAGAPTLGGIPTLINTGTSGATTLANTGAAGGPGTLTAGTPTYGDLITQAYGSIGRTGFGTGTANIDQPGYDYWMSELTSGRLTPDNFRSTFDRAVDQFIAANPDNVYTRQALETRLPSMFTTGTGTTGLAGTGTAGQKVDFNTLNRGFEWAQANKFDEAALKRILGNKTYDQYADLYGRGILWSLQPALADKQISGQEALDVVSNAKKFGLDNPDEIARFTKLNPAITKAFFDTYDTTLKGIVGNALDSKSTVSEGQRAASLLALQQKYGLTDSDLASYSGGKAKAEDFTNYFAPARTFQADLQKVFNDPNSTAKDIVNFIDRSRTSGAVNALYGDRLNEMESSGQLGTLRRLADIGKVKDADNKEYDPLTVVRLAGQIGQNFDPSRSSGGAFRAGSDTMGFTQEEANRLLGKEATGPEKVILDMARYLASKGVTNINQLRRGEIDIPESVIGGEAGDQIVPGRRETGVFFGDKKLTTGNEFGATYAGAGNTRYNVDFDPATGQPRFYTSAQSSSDLSGGLGTLIALGASIFGAPMLGTLLGNLGVTGLANTMLSRGILSGALSEMSGGDFGKGFAGGAIGAGAGNLAGSLLPTGFDPTIGRAVTGITEDLARSAVTGQGNLGDIFKSGILSGGLNYGLGQAFDALNLTPAQVNLLTGIVAPAALGQGVNPLTLISTLARTGQQAGATR